jgi:GMP synthase-like glutamine amidotransferase
VVTLTQTLRYLLNEHKSSVKILGVCFGHQLLTDLFGGEVKYSGSATKGATKISLHQDKLENLRFEFLEPLRGYDSLIVTQTHSDEVSKVPNKFQAISSSDNCKHEIIVSECGRFLGMQCHPEFTTRGMLTQHIQLAHHQHKEKSGPIIMSLLKRLETEQKDEHSHLLRNVISKFIAEKKHSY